MVALRQRNLKLFTVTLTLFAITVTSVFLNYTQSSGLATWSPEKYFSRFSEQFRRFITSSRRLCSCEACVAEPDVSLWFDERYNLSIPPLLTKQNNVIPESVYKWWLRLQGERNPKDINKVIRELFEIVPSDLDLVDHGPYRCRSCAVVGNSGNLKNSLYGPDIDRHDFIFRMNHAPTAKFENDVGSRTTHHFLYPESVKELQENVSMVLIPFKTLDLQWIVSALTNGSINFTYVPVQRKIRISKEKILVYSPEFMKYIYDKWLLNHGRYPSTGLLSVIFALHVCDKVDIYGFGADSRGHWHHYWENNPGAGAFRQTGVHDGDFEASIIGNLSAIDKVMVFRGR
ncbi:CMP-N-acetylneuraminate-beta-galactosamide-alpha-2,3-sialyltransferase 1 [Spea bombifrons]|uniref:CMP-N-acetylneuraminate-beta-galactosamide- alpha-2,3-sialyltransferase 1 n=1 Tax=Spea bombifrons TaxID=233779 RepID=UPI002349871C|nr:CMP-N-acetylneuraminate-beta-galactosamide-alpha-2,3-sialyltransferase 1 [Spea bombifrons]